MSIKSETYHFKNAALPLAVVIGATRWDEPPRMRHQVARQLMRWFNVLFVEFFPCDGSGENGTNLRRIDDRLIVCRPHVRLLPNVRVYVNLPYVHRLVNRRYVKVINDVLRSIAHPPAVLCNFVPFFPEIMSGCNASLKIYFCHDEWPNMWRSATKPNTIKFAYQSYLMKNYEIQVAKAADICLACHTPLQKRLSEVNKNSLLLLHGHEFTPTSQAKRNNASIRVAYMGYITYNMLTEWLFAVLENPDIELNLIGPINKFDPTPFVRYPNFRHVPPLTGTALQDVLAGMDVLVMPYNAEIPEVHAQTVSNKFFQYVAAGCPVVISDMPYYISMPEGVIYRARNASDFVAKIRQAHAEDCDEFRKLRAIIAAENSWDKRGEQLHAILDKNLGDMLPDVPTGIKANV